MGQESRQGLLIFNEQGKLLHMCPTAQKYLFQIGQPNRFGGSREQDLVPATLKRMVGNYVALFKGNKSVVSPPSCVIRKPWGVFEFSAQWLNAVDLERRNQIAVTVHLREAEKVRLLNRCRELNFTQKQTQISIMVADGMTYSEIASQLSISKYTMKDHINALFLKLNAKNKSEFLRKVLLPG